MSAPSTETPASAPGQRRKWSRVATPPPRSRRCFCGFVNNSTCQQPDKRGRRPHEVISKGACPKDRLDHRTGNAGRRDEEETRARRAELPHGADPQRYPASIGTL